MIIHIEHWHYRTAEVDAEVDVESGAVTLRAFYDPDGVLREGDARQALVAAARARQAEIVDALAAQLVALREARA